MVTFQYPRLRMWSWISTAAHFLREFPLAVTLIQDIIMQ